jgi:AcrR family transcriptional regulator
MSQVALSIVTPWGRSHALRERMLPPGPGTPAEQVAENQRQRLFGAMVASVAERGYGATRVTDLVQISGVSSRSFYDLFPDKQACFLATLEVLLGGTDAEQGIGGFAAIAVAQPAATRLCLIDVFAAGPEASRLLELKFGSAEAATAEQLAEAPEEMATMLVGAVIELARDRLLRGAEEELPGIGEDLVELVAAFRPPTRTLRISGRPPAPKPEVPEAHDHAERGLRAFESLLAEQGYVETTMEQVAKRAAMSAKTLYANFDGKQEVLLAAIDSAGAQIVATVMPAFRRNAVWAEGVRAAFAAFFSLLASRPAMARLMMDELFAAGPAAIERRAQALRPLRSLLAAGSHYSPQAPGFVPEALLGGVFALCRKRIRDLGPETLPALAPLATYVTLAPFLGADEATAAANGEGPRRGTEKRELARALAAEPSIRTLLSLWRSAGSPSEVAAELDRPEAEIATRLAEMFRAGLVQQVGERIRGDDVEPVYAMAGQLIGNEEWESLSAEDRGRISAEILQVIAAEVEQAVELGSFDARADRHLSRIGFLTDEQGWAELGEVGNTALSRLLEIQAASIERMKQPGAAPTLNARAMLTLFEMPPDPE